MHHELATDPRPALPPGLYVVATPLGNLGDLTLRAVEVLRGVDVVAAEDTRRSRVLLDHIGARPALVSFHAHSTDSRRDELVARLESGQSVALVTDAGTPSISDPGGELVQAARAKEVSVVPIPGPSAVAAALSVSGLPADRFTFFGFMPRRGTNRHNQLAAAASSPVTAVIFEAAPRLVTLLEDLIERCGEARAGVVAREITKLHEEVQAGTLAELLGYYRSHPPRGEITVLISGATLREKPIDHDTVAERGRALLDAGMSRRDAAAHIATELPISRNDAYRIMTEL